MQRCVRFPIWLTACLLILLGFSGQQAHAQKIQFQRLDGLPDQFVYALEFDDQGYLWAGTGSGLFRYSGTGRAIFSTDDGLADDFTAALCHQNGNLFAGHFSGASSRIDAMRNCTALEYDGGVGIVAMLPTVDSMVIAIPQTGPPVVLGPTGVALDFAYNGPENTGTVVRCALALAEDRFILGTSNGLAELRFDGQKLVVQALPDFSPDIQVTALALGPNKQLLAGTQSSGLLECTEASSSWKIAPCFETSESVRAIVTAPDGTIWAGIGRNLHRFTPQADGSVESIVIGAANGFPETVIETLACDPEGQLWIGTRGAGLLRLPNPIFSLLESDEVLALTAGKRANLYAGTANGVYLLNVETHTVREAGHIPYHEPVLAIAEWQSGLAFATASGSLLFHNGETISNLDALGELLGSQPTHLLVGPNGQLWIATISRGVAILNPETGAIKLLNTQNGLLHNDVYQIYFDTEGAAWFVTTGTGLARYKNEQFTYYDSDNGLVFPDFTSIVSDHNDRMWITTSGGGLFEQTADGFLNYNTTTGLPANQFRGMAFTHEDGGWLVSATGLYSFTKSTGTGYPYAYLPDDLSMEFTPGTVVPLDNGMIALGTTAGLALLHPDHAATAPLAVPNIVQLRVNGFAVPLNNKLELGFDPDHLLEFEYGGVCLSQPGAMQYSYKLEGLNTEWLDGRISPSVVYSGLDYGSYRFLVRTSLPGQEWSEPAAFEFTILTPVWRQPWFLTLVVLLLVAVPLLFFRWRERQLRKEKLVLEIQVRQRTRELEEQKNQLQRLTYAISHDLKNPVINISGLTDVLRELVPDKDEETEEVLEMLGTNARHLQSNLASLMSVLKAQSGVEKTWTMIELNQLLTDVKATLAILIQGNKAVIRADFSAIANVEYPQEDLQSILYNLVSNAIKYRAPDRAPEVHLSTEDTPDAVLLHVQDNGMGIDMDKHGKKLFSIFKRIHDHVEGSGVGLHLIKSVIEKNGGTISVESTPDKGSRFTVELPKQR